LTLCEEEQRKNNKKKKKREDTKGKLEKKKRRGENIFPWINSNVFVSLHKGKGEKKKKKGGFLTINPGKKGGRRRKGGSSTNASPVAKGRCNYGKKKKSILCEEKGREAPVPVFLNGK